MRFNPFTNVVPRAMTQRATIAAMGLFVASMAWADANIEKSVDWVIDREAEATGELSISLSTEPKTLVYGDVIEATIDVTNGTTEDRPIDIRVLLGEGAHFVSGDHGVEFLLPDQVQIERELEWPDLFLPAGASGRVSFQFLVTWDTTERHVSIEAEAFDPMKDEPRAVVQFEEPQQYPAGRGSFLDRYGYLVLTFVLGIGLMISVWRAKRRFDAGDSIARSLSGVCMGAGIAIILICMSVIGGEFVPWFGWKQTTGTILDVRYSKETRSSHRLSQGPASTTTFYSGTLALRYEGPDGPVISSGYRTQSGFLDDPVDILNEYQAGSETICYYDPSSPVNVVVERNLDMIGLLKSSASFVIGVLLFWIGFRSSSNANTRESTDQP